jgi:hypothetical protein
VKTENLTVEAFIVVCIKEQWRSQKFGLGVHLNIFGQKGP